MMYLCSYCWAYCRPSDISILATEQFPCGCCAGKHEMARVRV